MEPVKTTREQTALLEPDQLAQAAFGTLCQSFAMGILAGSRYEEGLYRQIALELLEEREPAGYAVQNVLQVDLKLVLELLRKSERKGEKTRQLLEQMLRLELLGQGGGVRKAGLTGIGSLRPVVSQRAGRYQKTGVLRWPTPAARRERIETENPLSVLDREKRGQTESSAPSSPAESPFFLTAGQEVLDALLAAGWKNAALSAVRGVQHRNRSLTGFNSGKTPETMEPAQPGMSKTPAVDMEFPHPEAQRRTDVWGEAVRRDGDIVRGGAAHSGGPVVQDGPAFFNRPLAWSGTAVPVSSAAANTTASTAIINTANRSSGLKKSDNDFPSAEALSQIGEGENLFLKIESPVHPGAEEQASRPGAAVPASPEKETLVFTPVRSGGTGLNAFSGAAAPFGLGGAALFARRIQNREEVPPVVREAQSFLWQSPRQIPAFQREPYPAALTLLDAGTGEQPASGVRERQSLSMAAAEAAGLSGTARETLRFPARSGETGGTARELNGWPVELTSAVPGGGVLTFPTPVLETLEWRIPCPALSEKEQHGTDTLSQETIRSRSRPVFQETLLPQRVFREEADQETMGTFLWKIFSCEVLHRQTLQRETLRDKVPPLQTGPYAGPRIQGKQQQSFFPAVRSMRMVLAGPEPPPRTAAEVREGPMTQTTRMPALPAFQWSERPGAEMSPDSRQAEHIQINTNLAGVPQTGVIHGSFAGYKTEDELTIPSAGARPPQTAGSERREKAEKKGVPSQSREAAAGMGTPETRPVGLSIPGTNALRDERKVLGMAVSGAKMPGMAVPGTAVSEAAASGAETPETTIAGAFTKGFVAKHFSVPPTLPEREVSPWLLEPETAVYPPSDENSGPVSLVYNVSPPPGGEASAGDSAAGTAAVWRRQTSAGADSAAALQGQRESGQAQERVDKLSGRLPLRTAAARDIRTLHETDLPAETEFSAVSPKKTARSVSALEQILVRGRLGETHGVLEHMETRAAARNPAPGTAGASPGTLEPEGKTAASIGTAPPPSFQLPPSGFPAMGAEIALLMGAPLSQSGQGSQMEVQGGRTPRFGLPISVKGRNVRSGVQGEENTFRFGSISSMEKRGVLPEAQKEETMFRFGVTPHLEGQNVQPGMQGEEPVLHFGVTPQREAQAPLPGIPGQESKSPLPPEELTYVLVQIQRAAGEEAAPRQEVRSTENHIRWSRQSSPNSMSFSAGNPLQSGVGDRSIASVRPIDALPPAGGESQRQIQWTAPGLDRKPAEMSFRQQEPAPSASAPSPVLSDRELRRAADRVYQMIEDRLRQERRRLDL